ncbi:trypsin-like serine protease [Bdellovibrio bacteriovorus]|uniref:S1 family peptidase n=1 Tax=Bdellovibrio TaxID=958 RepID=UPI0035A8BF89
MNKTKLYVSSLIVLALTACGGSQSEVDTQVYDAAIVGGKDTTKDNVISKYVVLIYDNPTKTYCTGLLIKKDVILTAAHCVPSGYKSLTLAFGIKPLAGDYVMKQAANMVVHDKYKKENSNDRNDLALILIKGNAPEGYKTLLLPGADFPLKAGYGFTATGYGRISGKKVPSSDTQGSGYLRHVELKIDSFNANESQFYVDQKSGRGICSGDSGGPALMRYEGQDYVVGIASAISWTLPDEIHEDEKKQYIENKDVCLEKSIYMNVKKHRTWIDAGLKKLLN